MARLSIPLAAAALLLLAACGGGGTLQNGTFRAPHATYHLDSPPRPWRLVSFRGNDLAWADDAGRVLAVNAVCDGHGDPSLKVLTDHLLLGFEGRQVLEREELHLDGRGALRTRANAALDGVPVEMELTLLKKNGCVYDLVYTAPRGGFEGGAGAYRDLVRSFSTTGRAAK